ncbi:hypothetical protein MUY14_23590 [Amycolatopsis sp. FBCC-B4732]|uniref:hypothetical protein n=1 Tax=Amycolatopsis sp. FBCC-B4732 TaxID=3079339 RepID=UPI001FF20757|nr:hypothetical protein [Amycolatopsis sp. FBCC-B4732]UOX84799.1 hypothetical protein MUY14_23590 [Amycolatopsis sp. FBCC-B4732]
MRTLLGTVLLLLTLTACGARSDSGATSSSPSSSSSASVPAPPPPSQTVGRPTQGIAPGDDVIAESQVDARSLPEGYPRSLTRSLDGKTLTLQAEEGGCRHISARVGEQTAQQVVVLIAVSSAKKGQMCPDYIREITVPLALTEPLGTRTVVLHQG